MWLHFFPHWAVTPQKDLKLACLSTWPAIRCAVANILAELIETFDLVLGIAAIFSKHVSASGPAAGLGPYLVGALDLLSETLATTPFPRRTTTKVPMNSPMKGLCIKPLRIQFD